MNITTRERNLGGLTSQGIDVFLGGRRVGSVWYSLIKNKWRRSTSTLLYATRDEAIDALALAAIHKAKLVER